VKSIWDSYFDLLIATPAENVSRKTVSAPFEIEAKVHLCSAVKFAILSAENRGVVQDGDNLGGSLANIAIDPAGQLRSSVSGTLKNLADGFRRVDRRAIQQAEAVNIQNFGAKAHDTSATGPDFDSASSLVTHSTGSQEATATK